MTLPKTLKLYPRNELHLSIFPLSIEFLILVELISKSLISKALISITSKLYLKE